jgi:hypothetical protein
VSASRDVAAEIAALGGAAAPATATARLRNLVAEALAHGAAELELRRSGYSTPVTVLLAAAGDGRLLAATPAPAELRVDPEKASERAWLLVAATLGALLELAGARPPRAAAELGATAGQLGPYLALGAPGTVQHSDLDELGPLAFEEQLGRVDRLRARALTVPAAALADAVPSLKPPIGAGHPLRIAEVVARMGGRPADGASVEAHEDAILALLGAEDPAGHRPHEDPDPARRAARRILQRLDGMGKWGGYHTEFAHLARGFAGNEKALAQEVGEALLQAGLLAEKPSVGQRHVFLNPRRAADIHALIERGDAPPDLRLP